MAGLQLSGLASGMDTDTVIKDLMRVEQAKIDKIDKQKTKLEMKQDVWKDMNTKLYSFYTKNVFDLKSSGSYKTKSATVSDDTKVGVSATSAAVAGVHTVEVTQLAKGAHLYSNTIADDTVVASQDMTFKVFDGKQTVDIELKQGAKVADLVAAINEKKLTVTASYDSTNKRIFLNSTTTGDASKIEFSEVDAGVERTFLTSLGFSVNGTTIKDSESGILGSTGQKSKYKYDGVEFEAASNSVSINGISLTLKADLSNVTINITNNSDAVYNKIKDFVKAYNTLLEDMNSKINAESNKYEPLTAAEKETLDEKTVTKWEDKIKEALLRRDDKLASIANSMRSIVTTSNGVDVTNLTTGFKYLSDVGVSTGLYTEAGKLHIDGDSEDATVSLKTNKLKAAIEANPEKVEELFKAIGTALYSDMTTKMKSSTLNSALTLYNDKEMKKQVTDYSSKITKLTDHMATMETRYRKQFTTMEQAIQRSNDQSSSLMNMLSGFK